MTTEDSAYATRAWVRRLDAITWWTLWSLFVLTWLGLTYQQHRDQTRIEKLTERVQQLEQQ